LWRHRDGVVAGPAAALAVVVTAVMAFVLLGRSPDFLPVLEGSGDGADLRAEAGPGATVLTVLGPPVAVGADERRAVAARVRGALVRPEDAGGVGGVAWG
ncbi:hypothetical protein, partial [Nocardioides sp. YIM 152588]|uniref:hypothetical protein n=1 Tax=Nocardioides sp. YIM 152588 TaxID=3158259 RepID=UPI0032E50BA4